jgi:hypothetical protein
MGQLSVQSWCFLQPQILTYKKGDEAQKAIS